MKFTIHRRPLLAALQQAGTAVDTRSPFSLIHGVLIVANSQGIRILGTDTKIAIQTVISTEHVEIKSLGKVVIKAAFLIDVIKRMPDDMIQWECKQSRVKLTAGKKKMEIMGEDAEDFPSFKSPSGDGVQLDWETYRKMYSTVLYAASRKATEPVITGVHTETRDGKLIITATDRHRLARVTEDMDIQLDQSVIISAEHLGMIKNLFEDGATVTMTLTDSQAVFQADGITAYLQVLDGTYPLVNRILANDRVTTIKLSTSELYQSVSLARLTGEREEVHLDVKESILEISSYNEVGNRTEEAIPLADFSGTSIHKAFNGKYLLEAIKSIDAEEICISFMGERMPIVLSDGVESFAAHLLSPTVTR